MAKQVQLECLDGEALKQFHRYLSLRRAEKTVKAYVSDVKQFLVDIGRASLPMSEFEEEALTWLVRFKETKAHKTTLRRASSLRAFGEWALWPLDFSKVSLPKTPKSDPHPIPEGVAGVMAMIEVSNYAQAALISLCGLCGLRVEEALGVMYEDFDFGNMTLHVRGKGDKDRVVPVSKAAWESMTVAVGKAMISSRPVLPFSDRYARQTITDLAKRAKLKRHVSSHDLRSTFATEVYNQTLDIRIVQELLGHESVTTTQGYTGITLKKMKEAVELKHGE
jgi:site-specific recombinase XerD